MSGFNRLIVAILVLSVILAAVRAVRKRELSLSTGVIWVGGGVMALIPLSFEPVLTFMTQVIGAKYPASALTLYAFLFFAAIVIILSGKLERTNLELTRMSRALALLERRTRLLEVEREQTEQESRETKTLT